MLLLQFIKDCAYDVAASENTTTVPGVKPDIALRYVDASMYLRDSTLSVLFVCFCIAVSTHMKYPEWSLPDFSCTCCIFSTGASIR